MQKTTKFLLSENDIPRFYYNIMADSPVPATPVLNPVTKEPVTPEFLSALFPMNIIEQEVATDRYIEIPEEVRELYKLYRPTPLIRAHRLEKASAYLLQIRRGISFRKPQIKHRHSPGVLQQNRRNPCYDHRNRCRSMGISPFHGL